MLDLDPPEGEGEIDGVVDVVHIAVGTLAPDAIVNNKAAFTPPQWTTAIARI